MNWGDLIVSQISVGKLIKNKDKLCVQKKEDKASIINTYRLVSKAQFSKMTHEYYVKIL